jgi:hypothetical protein
MLIIDGIAGESGREPWREQAPHLVEPCLLHGGAQMRQHRAGDHDVDRAGVERGRRHGLDLHEAAAEVTRAPRDGLRVDVAADDRRVGNAGDEVPRDPPAAASPIENPSRRWDAEPRHLVDEVGEHAEALGAKRRSVQRGDPLLEIVGRIR